MTYDGVSKSHFSALKNILFHFHALRNPKVLGEKKIDGIFPIFLFSLKVILF